MTLRDDAGTVAQVLSRPLVALALVAGGAACGLLAALLARWCGWRRLPAVLAGFGLALALAVTLGRSGLLHPGIETFRPLGRCVVDGFALDSTGQRLNLVMLMPFAFFAVLATRRPLLVVAACVALSAGIELTQVVLGIGACDTQDLLANTAGGVLAALAGWLVAALTSRPRPNAFRTRPTRTTPPAAGPGNGR